MSTYTIGEVADRSGFSASALRYYEDIFSFAVTVDGWGIALEVRAPDDSAGVVADLFGTAA